MYISVVFFQIDFISVCKPKNNDLTLKRKMDRKTEFLSHRCIKPHHIIVMMSMSMILGFVCAYAISVSSEHVEALFPYISDTGAKPPASCVFGLFLNIAGMFVFMIIYLRHRQYEKYYALEINQLHILNDISMLLGYASALGALLVANFQEVNVISVHIIGAFMTFVIGNIYCWIQSYLSIFSLISISRGVVYLRFLLTCVSSVMFVMVLVFTSLATGRLRNSDIYNDKDKWSIMLNWKSTYPGYDCHLVSTFTEWIMVICFLLYFITFYKEFKQISCKLVMDSKLYSNLVSDTEVIA